MASEIIQKEDKLLRKIAKEVSMADIKSRKTETTIRRMQKTLDNEKDGVAIAAPQIGESLRIFVVSKKIFEIIEEEKGNSKRTDSDKLEKYGMKDMIFINPEILKISKEKMVVEEGCLSIRWLYGKVSRSKKVKIRAYDQNGRSFMMGGSGLLAQVFQHEIDHLNGILFIDTAKDLKDMPPEDNAK